MGTKAKDEDRKGRLNRGDSIFDGGKKVRFKLGYKNREMVFTSNITEDWRSSQK